MNPPPQIRAPLQVPWIFGAVDAKTVGGRRGLSPIRYADMIHIASSIAY